MLKTQSNQSLTLGKEIGISRDSHQGSSKKEKIQSSINSSDEELLILDGDCPIPYMQRKCPWGNKTADKSSTPTM